MTELLTRDADALHRALDKGGDEIKVSVSRETAEWLARLVDAKARGQEVLLTRGNAEVTPAEAAELLGSGESGGLFRGAFGPRWFGIGGECCGGEKGWLGWVVGHWLLLMWVFCIPAAYAAAG